MHEAARTRRHSGCRHGGKVRGDANAGRRAQKAREREREQLQRAHSHRARRAQRAHKATQRRVAPSTRRALYETTTSVTEAFCSRSAPIKRASAFCCILPLGVSRVACCRERQPALFFFGCRSANDGVRWGATLPALSVVELDKRKTPPRLTKTRRRHANLVSR